VPHRLNSRGARSEIQATFDEIFNTGAFAEERLWDAFVQHLSETKKQLRCFSPFDGLACTFAPALNQDPVDFPLRWCNRDCVVTGGNWSGTNFLIMRMSLVAVCAETEYFCQHALNCVKDKLLRVYEGGGCDWRASPFDWEEILKAAAGGGATQTRELAAMHFDRPKAVANLNKSMEDELNKAGINPTLFRGEL
jgi:hypothetical protein